jgi:pimeloyl-ACP methyl ester carboxylesterase
MYFIVFASSRYVAPFIVLLWIGVFSVIRLPEFKESRRLIKYSVILAVLIMLIMSIRQSVINRHFYSDDMHVQVAESIKKIGTVPGDKVASIGYSHPHFWARLAKVRIVAEIPDEDTEYFWETHDEVKLKMFDAFRRAGAKLIVAKSMTDRAITAEWQKIANSEYYVYKIPPGDTEYSYPAVSVFDEIPPEYFRTDVDKLIEIRDSEDITLYRNRLVRFLWGDPGLPKSLPSVFTINFKDSRYYDIANLKRIDKLVVNMDFGLESRIYHFIPSSSNNKVVLFHQGHMGDFYHSKEQIMEFLNNRYAVVAFCMPLRGLNNQPEIYLPRLGLLKLKWNHDLMKFLSPESGHPLKYFIEPVVIALNYLDDRFGYEQTSMVGVSGGGWTTTIAAAVDPRIIKSFPVAGSLPIYLRSNSRNDWSDYENTEPQLYRTVNYPELYILGAYGAGRKQLQILNKYDSCCFEGIKWQTYKDIVRDRVFGLGHGEYDLFMDDTHKHHQISEEAMERILTELYD